MNPGIAILLAILATYRVSFLITSEEGPFGLAQSFRSAFDRAPGWMRNGVHCVLCASFWLSMIPAIYLGWVWSLTQADAALLWLGIAGGVVFVAKVAR